MENCKVYCSSEMQVARVLRILGLETMYNKNSNTTLSEYNRSSTYIQMFENGDVHVNGINISIPFNGNLNYNSSHRAYEYMAEGDGNHTFIIEGKYYNIHELLFAGQCKADANKPKVAEAVKHTVSEIGLDALLIDYINSSHMRVDSHNIALHAIYDMISEKYGTEEEIILYMSKILSSRSRYYGNKIIMCAELLGAELTYKVMTLLGDTKYHSTYYTDRDTQNQYNSIVFSKGGNSISSLKQFINSSRDVIDYISKLDDTCTLVSKIITILNKSSKTKGFGEIFKLFVTYKASNVLKGVDKKIITKLYPEGLIVNGHVFCVPLNEDRVPNPMSYTYTRLTTCGTRSDNINLSASVFFAYVNGATKDQLEMYSDEIAECFGRFIYEKSTSTGNIEWGLSSAIKSIITDEGTLINRENMITVLNYCGKYFNELNTTIGFKKFYSFISDNECFSKEVLSELTSNPDNVKLAKAIKRMNMESKLK